MPSKRSSCEALQTSRRPRGLAQGRPHLRMPLGPKYYYGIIYATTSQSGYLVW